METAMTFKEGVYRHCFVVEILLCAKLCLSLTLNTISVNTKLCGSLLFMIFVKFSSFELCQLSNC